MSGLVDYICNFNWCSLRLFKGHLFKRFQISVTDIKLQRTTLLLHKYLLEFCQKQSWLEERTDLINQCSAFCAPGCSLIVLISQIISFVLKDYRMLRCWSRDFTRKLSPSWNIMGSPFCLFCSSNQRKWFNMQRLGRGERQKVERRHTIKKNIENTVVMSNNYFFSLRNMGCCF